MKGKEMVDKLCPADESGRRMSNVIPQRRQGIRSLLILSHNKVKVQLQIQTVLTQRSGPELKRTAGRGI